MSEVQIQPSPEGVPGAVSDPSLLAAEEVSVPGFERTPLYGYLARPSRPGTLPGMIVLHDAGGVSEHTRDITRRIAALGYVTLAVDLFTREGGPPPSGDIQALMERLFSMDDARILGDLEGAADFLRARGDLSGKLGCIGFCMGGRLTLLFACASDRLDAAVDCWGGFIDMATLEDRTTPLRPTPPLEMVARLRCPLMAAIGAEDSNPSPEVGERLRQALAQLPQETVVDVYEGAGHAFFADYRPSYRPVPAALLWERVVPFLERHLATA
jgi:carboxymethylenebutenolidase